MQNSVSYTETNLLYLVVKLHKNILGLCERTFVVYINLCFTFTIISLYSIVKTR